MSETKKQQCHIKKVPEGGFGYVIVLGLAVPFSCIWGVVGCFGFIYDDFIKSVGGETTAVGVIMGCFGFAISIGGLSASILFKTLPIRTVGLIGSLMFVLGNVIPIIATSVHHLIISNGILQGFGVGFMIPSLFTTFNEYFVKRRVLMMSIAQTLVSVGCMMYPILVQFLMTTYGYRGALMVLAAISAHTTVGMLCMHPVKWHYKTIKIPYEEAKPFLNSNTVENGIEESVTCENDGKLDKNVEETKIHLDVIKEVSCERNNENDSKSIKSEHHEPLYPTDELREFNSTQIRYTMVSTMGNGDNVALQPSKTGKWQKVVHFLDLSLLKDMVYVNVAFGAALALFSETTFLTLLPIYLNEIEISKDNTALLLSVAAFFDLGARIFLTVISFCVSIKARYIFLTGAVMTIVVRFVFLNVFDFVGLAIAIGLLGFFKTFIHLPLPLMFAENLPKEKFAPGYGLFMFIQGTSAFAVSPIIGWIRDATKSYVISFHALTFCMAMCAVPWLIEIAWFRVYPRKRAIDNEK